MINSINNTLSVLRPDIRPTHFSKPYWEGTREKKLLLQFCPRSGKYQFFPRPVSIFSGRRDLQWREVSGRGEIYSFTIVHMGTELFTGHEPYIIAIVELDEGVRILANLVDCELDWIQVGRNVVPSWAPLPNGEHQLMFKPAP